MNLSAVQEVLFEREGPRMREVSLEWKQYFDNWVDQLTLSPAWPSEKKRRGNIVTMCRSFYTQAYYASGKRAVEREEAVAAAGGPEAWSQLQEKLQFLKGPATIAGETAAAAAAAAGLRGSAAYKAVEIAVREADKASFYAGPIVTIEGRRDSDDNGSDSAEALKAPEENFDAEKESIKLQQLGQRLFGLLSECKKVKKIVVKEGFPLCKLEEAFGMVQKDSDVCQVSTLEVYGGYDKELIEYRLNYVYVDCEPYDYSLPNPKPLFGVLEALTHLQWLVLNGIRLEEGDVKRLLGSVSSQLCRLEMECMDLPGRASGALVCLVRLSKLKHLVINETELWNRGGKALSLALRGMQNLQHLDLSSSMLGSKAGLALASSIHYATELQNLDLHGNCLKDVDTEALLVSIANLRKMKTLDLSCNQVSQDGVAALKKRFALMTNLKDMTLDLESNQSEEESSSEASADLDLERESEEASSDDGDQPDNSDSD